MGFRIFNIKCSLKWSVNDLLLFNYAFIAVIRKQIYMCRFIKQPMRTITNKLYVYALKLLIIRVIIFYKFCVINEQKTMLRLHQFLCFVFSFFLFLFSYSSLHAWINIPKVFWLSFRHVTCIWWSDIACPALPLMCVMKTVTLRDAPFALLSLHL